MIGRVPPVVHPSIFRPPVVDFQTRGTTHRNFEVRGYRIKQYRFSGQPPEQERNEARIGELEDKLARAEIINVAKLSGDTIKFGATVTLIEEETGKKKLWQIVGEPEADVHKGKISVVSPIARALIGKSKGETIEGSSRWC
jgi:transcription elongation GreA/GreB family factor